MRKASVILIILNLIVVGFFFIRSLTAKEDILEDGKLVLLELAPVDPRSLMQGDYMDLSYAVLRELQADSLAARGYVILKLDEHSVGHYLHSSQQPIKAQPNKVAIQYFRQGLGYSIGAESFFFEEGQAETYQDAAYGGLRVDEEGNSVLVGLYNSSFQEITPPSAD